ncbi:MULTISPECIES: ribonuclease P protein component [Polymorphospora]|uniref:Ribonuclease P protein component n=1 Tax=Polymorphospora lycopeni TaxID=3140240 RepID=A0ABV5CHT5_9ACTN
MLATSHRLRHSREFAAAMRAGRRANRGSVVVHLDLGRETDGPGQLAVTKPARDAGVESGSPPSRAGFVVSKAVGGAVVRNLVRRRLRHLVRERIDTLPAGSTLVVRALPSAAEVPYGRLAADLDAALTAARTPRRASRSRR